MKTDRTRIDLENNGLTILRYRHGEVSFKPYLEELRTPSGRNILRDAPEDHLHHHALMFACKVDEVNFWEEQTAPGKQESLGIETFTSASPEEIGSARIVQRLLWLPPEAETALLEERREIVVHATDPDGPTLVSWIAEFAPPEGKPGATLGGAHYHGLGMRFLESMDQDGNFRNADNAEGEIVRGDERLSRSTWCAYTAKADGATVTAALFDHPDNPRHPAYWFTMQTPFAYLSATLNLHREPLDLQAGETLLLRYGAAVWDGAVDNEAIERTYRDWISRTGNSD